MNLVDRLVGLFRRESAQDALEESRAHTQEMHERTASTQELVRTADAAVRRQQRKTGFYMGDYFRPESEERR